MPGRTATANRGEAHACDYLRASAWPATRPWLRSFEMRVQPAPGQRVALQIGVLVAGRYSGIADNGGHRGRKPVQGSGLQTLQPYTNFLPVENPAKAFYRSAPGFGQETPPLSARRALPIRLTKREPAPMSASPSQLS
jgi:hypothetical protein